MQIILADSKQKLKQFIDFPHDLYQNDTCYVPELYLSVSELLNKKSSPFFEHSIADYFLAMQNGKVVGRIAAIKNNNYIAYTKEKTGFFGFFEVIDDFQVAKALLDTASNWLKKEGLTEMIGPASFSTNEVCGLLIDCFNQPPALMMPYNKAYYATLLERYGLIKKADLLAYWVGAYNAEKIVKLLPTLEKRLESSGITIRKMNLSNLKQEIDRIREIYDASWEKNWGFVPMTSKEFQTLGKNLKFIASSDFLYIAEKEREPIAFSISLPDFNQVFIQVKRGRLFPFGWLKLLYYRRKINRIRIIALGVKEAYRKMGLEVCFYARNLLESRKRNYTGGEASWILADNAAMRSGLDKLEAEATRTYRMYTKSV